MVKKKRLGISRKPCRRMLFSPTDWIFKVDGQNGEAEAIVPQRRGNMAQLTFVIVSLGKLAGVLAGFLESGLVEAAERGSGIKLVLKKGRRNEKNQKRKPGRPRKRKRGRPKKSDGQGKGLLKGRGRKWRMERNPRPKRGRKSDND